MPTSDWVLIKFKLIHLDGSYFIPPPEDETHLEGYNPLKQMMETSKTRECDQVVGDHPANFEQKFRVHPGVQVRHLYEKVSDHIYQTMQDIRLYFSINDIDADEPAEMDAGQ